MPYRDVDDEAARARRALLAADLAALDERIATRRRLAVLQLPTEPPAASPCDARWDRMEGSERARRCDQCALTVVDVAGLDASAAAALLAENGIECGASAPWPWRWRRPAVHRRADGTLLARECPVGKRRATRPRDRRRLLEVAVVLVIFAALPCGVVPVVPADLRALERSRARQARSDAMTIRSATQLYLADDHATACPTVDDLVRVGVLRATTPTSDPWGNEFRISCGDEKVSVSSAGLVPWGGSINGWRRRSREAPASRTR